MIDLTFAAGCSEAPTAPEEEMVPPDPELSVITPLLLPPGADWDMYFVSFNQTRTLHARVIHCPDGSASGTGSFTVSGGPSGYLRITSAEPYGDCLPKGSPCGTVTNVPESAVTRGTATLLTGRRVPFTLDLHSNFWPVASTYDTATLTLCYTTANCRSYSVFTESSITSRSRD
ncbi:MAG TPA: hypothetical protein VE399_03465 [Gemmatimonadales bacterium]|nr:hypothetical protein [Gemmatimonadales bacterium]